MIKYDWEKMKTCKHHGWVLFSVSYKERALLVYCVECDMLGKVRDPSEQEWIDAYSVLPHSPDFDPKCDGKPYTWVYNERVEFNLPTEAQITNYMEKYNEETT